MTAIRAAEPADAPAIAALMPNVMANVRPVSTPSTCAARGFWAVARIARPGRECFKN